MEMYQPTVTEMTDFNSAFLENDNMQYIYGGYAPGMGGIFGASSHPRRSNSRSGYRLFARVSNSMNRSVNGLNTSTRMPPRDVVFSFFSQFGVVLDCYLPESATNVAYLCFEDEDTMEAILQIPEHLLCVEGVYVTLSRASPRPDYSMNNTDRIFVKNCPDNINRTDLRNYFAQFGLVTDVYIPKDKITGEQKKFAFVTFANIESARSAISFGDTHRLIYVDRFTNSITTTPLQVMPAEARPMNNILIGDMIGGDSDLVGHQAAANLYSLSAGNNGMRNYTGFYQGGAKVFASNASSKLPTSTGGLFSGAYLPSRSISGKYQDYDSRSSEFTTASSTLAPNTPSNAGMQQFGSSSISRASTSPLMSVETAASVLISALAHLDNTSCDENHHQFDSCVDETNTSNNSLDNSVAITADIDDILVRLSSLSMTGAGSANTPFESANFFNDNICSGNDEPSRVDFTSNNTPYPILPSRASSTEVNIFEQFLNEYPSWPTDSRAT